jgi:hypothetical protein
MNLEDLKDVLTTDDVEEAYKHIVESPLLLTNSKDGADNI